jgi:acyl carrier protein
LRRIVMDGESAHRIVDHHIAAWTCVWSSEDTLESLGLDSLDTMDLLYQVSRESGVSLSDLEKREGLRVKDILDALKYRQAIPV